MITTISIVLMLLLHLGASLLGGYFAHRIGRKSWAWGLLCLLVPVFMIFLSGLRPGEKALLPLAVRLFIAIVFSALFVYSGKFWIEAYAQIVVEHAMVLFDAAGMMILIEGNVLVHENGRLGIDYRARHFLVGAAFVCITFSSLIHIKWGQPAITVVGMFISVFLSHIVSVVCFIHRVLFGISLKGKGFSEEQTMAIDDIHYNGMTLLIFVTIGALSIVRKLLGTGAEQVGADNSVPLADHSLSDF